MYVCILWGLSKKYPFEVYQVVPFLQMLMGRTGVRSRGRKETQNTTFPYSCWWREQERALCI